jgi:hypothetical protein
VNEAEISIAQTLLPRDWTPLRDVVLQTVAFFGGTHGPGRAMINRYLHEGLLELALAAPDGRWTEFSRAECERRTIHAPLNPAEGVRAEPYEAGQYLVRLAKSIPPATPTAAADRPMARAEESMSEPVSPVEPEPSRVEPVPPPPKPDPAAESSRLGRGRRREKRNAAAEKMRADLCNQRLTPDGLRSMKQEALA